MRKYNRKAIDVRKDGVEDFLIFLMYSNLLSAND